MIHHTDAVRVEVKYQILNLETNTQQILALASYKENPISNLHSWIGQGKEASRQLGTENVFNVQVFKLCM